MQISILGDSICTFSGWNPIGYKVFYDQKNQFRNGMKTVDDTWWQQVVTFLGGEVCVNNSYSGSRVSGEKFPAAHCKERIASLHNEQQPDVILVYMGLNDFGSHVPIRRKCCWLRRGYDPRFFLDAYALMLSQIRSQYPEAKILCATLLKSHVRNHPEWHFDHGFHGGQPLEKYNAAIRQACRKQKVSCLQLQPDGVPCTYETVDGAHPTAKAILPLPNAGKMRFKNVLGKDEITGSNPVISSINRLVNASRFMLLLR